MKVILTENQLELLRVIKENEEAISQFELKYNKIKSELNKLYTKVNFISIAEILSGEVNIKELVNQIETLDNLNYGITSKVDAYFNQMGEENYSDKFEVIHLSLDDMYRVNNDKVNIISLILNNLDTMVSELADGDGIGFEGIKKVFSDINSINLD